MKDSIPQESTLIVTFNLSKIINNIGPRFYFFMNSSISDFVRQAQVENNTKKSTFESRCEANEKHYRLGVEQYLDKKYT